MRQIVFLALLLSHVVCLANKAPITFEIAMRSSDAVVYGRAEVVSDVPHRKAGHNAFQIVEVAIERCWPIQSKTCRGARKDIVIVNPVGMGETRNIDSEKRYMFLLQLHSYIPITAGGIHSVLPEVSGGVVTEDFENSKPVTPIEELIDQLDSHSWG